MQVFLPINNMGTELERRGGSLSISVLLSAQSSLFMLSCIVCFQTIMRMCAQDAENILSL